MERGKLLKIMGVFIILSVFISASYASDPTDISAGDGSDQNDVNIGTDLNDPSLDDSNWCG